MHATSKKDRIRAAIRAAGGTAKLAAAMGLRSHESVRMFYARPNEIPAERARDFVRLTGGTMTLKEIRPDLWSELTAEELGYTVGP